MSSSTSDLAKKFVDGTDVDWTGLATLLVGSALTVFGIGIATVQNAVFGLAIGYVNWLTGFVSGLLAKALFVIIDLGTASWAAAIGALPGGTLGLVVGMTIGLVYLGIWGWGDD